MVSLLALGGSTFYYKERSEGLSVNLTQVTSQLNSFKKAAKLAAKLKAENEELAIERDALQKELLDAEDYNHPLSSTIRSALSRLQQGASTPRSTD